MAEDAVAAENPGASRGSAPHTPQGSCWVSEPPGLEEDELVLFEATEFVVICDSSHRNCQPQRVGLALPCGLMAPCLMLLLQPVSIWSGHSSAAV